MDALSELNALGFEHLLHWGKTRNVVWDPSRDCQSLAKYLAADPEDRYTRLALVDGLQNLGRLEEAVSVLALLPDSDNEARARRALLMLAGGDAPGADRLLAAGPADHPSLAKARGQIALGRHDPGGAIHHLQIALAAHPDDFGVLSALATARRAKGDEAGARIYIEAQRRHTSVTPLIARPQPLWVRVIPGCLLAWAPHARRRGGSPRPAPGIDWPSPAIRSTRNHSKPPSGSAKNWPTTPNPITPSPRKARRKRWLHTESPAGKPVNRKKAPLAPRERQPETAPLLVKRQLASIPSLHLAILWDRQTAQRHLRLRPGFGTAPSGQG